MTQALMVGLGGFAGALCRYGVGALFKGVSGAFPWATLIVNVTGCFVIGLLAPRLEAKPLMWALLLPGFLGGFTTFSAFGLEANALAQRGNLGISAVYVLASVVLGLGAVRLGDLMK